MVCENKQREPRDFSKKLLIFEKSLEVLYILWLVLLFFNVKLKANLPQKPTTVLTSIYPISLIIQELIKGMDENKPNVNCLIAPNQSIHDTLPSPSQILMCQKSNLIFWIGPQLETGMAPLFSRFPEKSIQLSADAELRDWMISTKHKHNCCSHKSKHNHSEKGDLIDLQLDWHIWCSPKGVELIAKQIQKQLSNIYPQYVLKIQTNLDTFLLEMRQRFEEGALRFHRKKLKPFAVSHVCYQHLLEKLGIPKPITFTALESTLLSPKQFFQIVEETKKHSIETFFVEGAPSTWLMQLKKHKKIDVVMTDLVIFNSQPPIQTYLDWLNAFIELLDKQLIIVEQPSQEISPD